MILDVYSSFDKDFSKNIINYIIFMFDINDLREKRISKPQSTSAAKRTICVSYFTERFTFHKRKYFSLINVNVNSSYVRPILNVKFY